MNNVTLPGAQNPNRLDPSSASVPAAQPDAATANPATAIAAGAPVVKSKSEPAAPILDVPQFLRFVADKIKQVFSGQDVRPDALPGKSSAKSYVDGKPSGSRPPMRDFSAEINDGCLRLWSIKNDEEMGALAEWLAASPPGLVKLDFYDCMLGDAHLTRLMAALNGNSLITSLEISLDENNAAAMASLAAGLKDNATLSSLYVANATFSENDAQLLASVFDNNTTLTTLNLGGSKIGDRGVALLATALKSNAVLTSLTLTDESIGVDGAASLAGMLKSNQTLDTLVIMNAQFGDAGAACLAEGLKENTALTSLVLIHTQFGDEGVASIAEALKFQTTLTHLTLDSNAINDIGATMLARMLICNQTLQSLNLGDNKIANKGAQKIAMALMNNAVLRRLSLKRNQIGDAGAEAMAQALQVNATLEHLAIAQYSHTFPGGLLPVSSAGLATLADMLKNNKSLTSVNLGLIAGCTDADAHRLVEAVELNETLTFFDVDFDFTPHLDYEANKKAKADFARITQRNRLPRLIAEGGVGLQVESGDQYPADVMFLIAGQLAELPAEHAGLAALLELGASIRTPPKA